MNIKKKTKIKRIHKSKLIKVNNLEIYDNSNSKKNIKDETKIIDNKNNISKIEDLNRFKIDQENEIEEKRDKGNKFNIKELNLTFLVIIFVFVFPAKKK